MNEWINEAERYQWMNEAERYQWMKEGRKQTDTLDFEWRINADPTKVSVDSCKTTDFWNQHLKTCTAYSLK